MGEEGRNAVREGSNKPWRLLSVSCDGTPATPPRVPWPPAMAATIIERVPTQPGRQTTAQKHMHKAIDSGPHIHGITRLMFRQHKYCNCFKWESGVPGTLAHRPVQPGFRVHAFRLDASAGRAGPVLTCYIYCRHQTRGRAQVEGGMHFLLHLA